MSDQLAMLGTIAKLLGEILGEVRKIREQQEAANTRESG